MAAKDRSTTGYTGVGDPSDGSLIRRFRLGDEDAATALYLRYAKRLQQLANQQTATDLAARTDADDIVQSVFRTFFRRASQGQYDAPEGDDLWRLLLVIALNKVRKAGLRHRAKKRDVAATQRLRNADSTLESDNGPNAEALTQLRMTIEELTESLPEAQRQIVEMRIEGFEVAEIARCSQRSKRSVERILQTFRKELAAIISEEDD